jgi:hypothetical protein
MTVSQTDGQILSYRYLAGSTEVVMRGTPAAPDVHIRLKVGSRPGFVELDINRGQIAGLKPANRFGRDFLTYVLWAVSVDGKAANLGEITFENDKPISINVTTPYQTFWLMMTAEPNYAVVDPSKVVVAYSSKEGHAPSEKIALTIPGSLFYYTHYANYDRNPNKSEPVPNALLQARKAVQLASKSDLLASHPSGEENWEEQRTREALMQAREFLARAEAAYKENPVGNDVAQFSRTAAQIAENARALAQGVVGGVQTARLESEVKQLQSELEAAKASGGGVVSKSTSVSATAPAASSRVIDTVVRLIAQPITWFCAIGWIVALLLLFRRRTI